MMVRLLVLWIYLSVGILMLFVIVFGVGLASFAWTRHSLNNGIEYVTGSRGVLLRQDDQEYVEFYSDSTRYISSIKYSGPELEGFIGTPVTIRFRKDNPNVNMIVLDEQDITFRRVLVIWLILLFASAILLIGARLLTRRYPLVKGERVSF